MAVEPEDDELLLDDVVDEGQQGEDQSGDLDEAELEVTFGEEAAPALGERDTGLVKHLREEIRDRDRRISELSQAQPQRIEIGPEPSLESCEYDEDRFKDEWRKWSARKTEAERQQADAGQAETQAREQWDRELQSYRDKRARLAYADLDEAEGLALSSLNQVQHAVIVKVAENPALLLYSLGRRADKLADISQIKDPLKLAHAVAKLEGGLKVMPRRRVAEPEEIAEGNRGVSRGTDKELERLEREAERTGDRTDVQRYKRQQKAA